MALSNLDNTGLTTTMNTWASSDYSSFANDMTTNFVGAWASRFALTPRQSTSLANVPASMQQQLINGANFAAAGLSAGYRIDALGQAFDKNPSGGSNPSITISIKADASYDPSTGIVTVSVEISISW